MQSSLTLQKLLWHNYVHEQFYYLDFFKGKNRENERNRNLFQRWEYYFKLDETNVGLQSGRVVIRMPEPSVDVAKLKIERCANSRLLHDTINKQIVHILTQNGKNDLKKSWLTWRTWHGSGPIVSWSEIRWLICGPVPTRAPASPSFSDQPSRCPGNACTCSSYSSLRRGWCRTPSDWSRTRPGDSGQGPRPPDTSSALELEANYAFLFDLFCFWLYLNNRNRA